MFIDILLIIFNVGTFAFVNVRTENNILVQTGKRKANVMELQVGL